MDLGDAVHRVRRLGVVADFEGDADCVLQEVHRFLRVTEQEVDSTEVVQQPAEIAAIGELLVRGLRPLGVGAREHPVALAVGDDRCLKIDVCRGALVVQPFGELERTLDVLPRGLEVAAAAVAA